MLNSLEGFTNVERERLELMKSLDASGLQTFRLIRLPTALPFIFAGLNLGIVYALLGTIVAEFIGAQRGMGVMITQLQSVSDTAGVFAAIITLSIRGYVLIGWCAPFKDASHSGRMAAGLSNSDRNHVTVRNGKR
ncbi:MAG TPA: ABC transporter permease subunit [Beijerinckiaceae bacterium]|nr:ABC transporter permease subunit [Beijerinckiaceae bacterium]